MSPDRVPWRSTTDKGKGKPSRGCTYVVSEVLVTVVDRFLSVLLETTTLALAGALIGAAATWLLFDGKHTTQARNVFDLSVSGHLIALGIAWALVLAVLGGVPPAIRAARRSVKDALAT